jgi:hypothetical protein
MRAHGTDVHTGAPGRSRGLPFVPVMQAADFRNDDDRSRGCWRDWSGVWARPSRAKMGPAPMIVLTVDCEDAAQMRVVKHDHMVQACSAD